MLASSAALDVLFWWLNTLHDPRPTWYSVLWPYSAAWMTLAQGAVVLTRCKPRWWAPLPAMALHVWAGQYPERWPGSWLLAEIHAVAFCSMVLGVALAVSPERGSRRLNLILAALFVGTGAAYYPTPWQPEIRAWLMWHQSACYLALAVAGNLEQSQPNTPALLQTPTIRHKRPPPASGALGLPR